MFQIKRARACIKIKMKVDTQRILDRYVGTVICRILSLFDRVFGKNSQPPEPHNILIILLSEMGALVLAYPMLQRLKLKYPQASLQVLLFEKNREVVELLGVIPAENILTISNRSMRTFARDTARVLAKMRRIKFDAVIDCELFSRISSILSFLSGAGIRVGFHPHTQEGLYRGNFINRPVLYNPYHHISRQFLTLVEAIASDTRPKAKGWLTDENIKGPKLTFEPHEIEGARERLVALAPDLAGKQIVLLYPGGGLLPIRAWPLEYFCRLAEEFLRKGYAVGVIGLAEDKEVAQTILARCQNRLCADLTGYTQTIRELMLIFHFAALLITNDGGPGHFAAMTPIPTIIFYGPETPVLYGNLDEKTVTFYLALSCSPCLTAYNHRNSPCDGDNLCLKNIDPEEVLRKALEILES
jgi:lipopolysaccharide heptosyltransferase II